ncbi:MAG: MBL fold metallo-hydrolase [Peptostreptococcaceae bacterium]|nr:MBL fold metallo-hydrolase [Peptostreptococcaceae bacterium]MDY5738587.1 MBL fold metallo-hydrolase [Anaerovoracaceae bacterium]
MEIKRIIGGSLMSNCYIIYQKSGGSCFVIDPGYSPKQYSDFVKEKELFCKGIILTHLHSDHTGGAEALAKCLSCPVMMHEDDFFVYKGLVDIKLKDGDSLDLDGERLEILHTPGHTKGGICIYSDKSKVAFTGDTIFDTDLGRTDLSGGSEDELKRSIRHVIDKWGNDVMIYPGHDMNANMKFVRKHNQEFIDIVSGKDREQIEYQEEDNWNIRLK